MGGGLCCLVHIQVGLPIASWSELTGRYLNSGPAGIGGMFVRRGLDPKDRR
jgi:kynureninase